MLDLDYKDVAEKYGGNKQKIAQAAAIGALGPDGPLLAVTAGMYIDRMRAAQVQEQMPQQTVAQQVLSPQAQPPMPQGGPGGPGLAGIAPPGMGAPPMMDAPAPPQGEMPAPPQGMAEGGYLPPYASGGLADLDIPDGMFDEPSNGGYANGGLIAFREGGDTSYGYNYNDPTANLAIQDQLFGAPQTKYADEAEQDFVLRSGEDYKKGQRKKDVGQLMAEAGFGMMAGTSPFAFQNIGAAMMPAISNATERAKERRGEERDIRKGLVDIEAGRNTAAAARASRALDMQAIGIKSQEAKVTRDFTANESNTQRDFERKQLLIKEKGDTVRAGIVASAKDDSDPKFNLTEDNFKIDGAGKRGTVIPRMRVTARGSNDYGYMYPDLGEAVIHPSHGAYAIGVRNAMLYAQQRGLAVSVGKDGKLQYLGSEGKPFTISSRRIKQFEALGSDFKPLEYDANLKRIAD